MESGEQRDTISPLQTIAWHMMSPFVAPKCGVAEPALLSAVQQLLLAKLSDGRS